MPTAPPRHRPPGWTPRVAWDHKSINQVKRSSGPWARKRLRVFERDKYVCQECQRVTLCPECDHIVALANGGTDDDANLQTLCKPCHKAKSQREATRGSHAAHPKNGGGV